MLAMVGRFFYLNQKGITITKDANILKVAGSKQSANGITDIFIINRVACAHRHTERAAPTATR